MRLRQEVFRCDKCGHQAVVQLEPGYDYGATPAQWVTVSFHDGTAGGYLSYLFCSRECAYRSLRNLI